MTNGGQTATQTPEAATSTRRPFLVQEIASDQLIFRPAPPQDDTAAAQVQMPRLDVEVDVDDAQFAVVTETVGAGALAPAEVEDALSFAGADDDVRAQVGTPPEPPADPEWHQTVEASYQQERLGLIAVELVDRAQKKLLEVEPLNEIHVLFTPRAKAALALGWEAIAKKGTFPLPPRGTARFDDLDRNPYGVLHFVSASDTDAGYLYTMGIAQSPEAQALGSMDVTYGLDGELIVPGQAVSPIPPFLALSTRLFAVAVPTSSNISEEVQSIPKRTFPHPASIDDLKPMRGGRLTPPKRPRDADEAITEIRKGLVNPEEGRPVNAVYEVTGLDRREIGHAVGEVLGDPVIGPRKEELGLYLNVEPYGDDRVEAINEVVDAAKDLGLKYVCVADDNEDSWLPHLLEYLEPDELNAVADYSDERGIIVTDGRPVDAVYTASTAAQRIQSVYTTLSVDILKMGMWLCLDALAARQVWREIISNPHIPRRMFLMPIGIVELWNAFVDNRDENRTARAILDPFEKIKFMIEEAAELGMPSLLTDTRHKDHWVLLGRKTPQDEKHAREEFDPTTGDPPSRTKDSAIPLLSWEEFMECERLAREAGIILGQAGSVEMDQLFRVITDCTYDAAKEKRNPATAIWTAETERVLRTSGRGRGNLQQQRGAKVSPLLAVINRGIESHAKVDGWLRYLADEGAGDEPLREELERRYKEVMELIEECLEVREDAGAYQAKWDQFRGAYLGYHDLVKREFARVRRDVAARWDGS